ncbi:MAG TPA: CapA family protein, partial [Thermoanaerobaculia bacterium]|nr:CapA family protein [Thermoanaerobaculia bacterium]
MRIVRLRALFALLAFVALAGCPHAAPPDAPPAIAMPILTPAPRPTLPPADAAAAQPPVRPFGDPPRRTKVKARATIAAVGDVLLHDGVQKCAALHATEINCEGYDELYKNVSQYLAAADLTFANVETPITLEAPNGTGAFQFNAPPISIKALQRAGVDVVSFANNHVYDQGRRGFRESMDILDLLGLPFLGSGRTRDEAYLPRIFEVNGMKIAFLAFTELLNDITKDEAPDGDPHVAMFDIKRAEKAV